MSAMHDRRVLQVRRWIVGLIIAVTTTMLAGCGTVFYPERKGQPSGRIDPAVAIADGVGLLFYIIPGVIAYAIDFSNGTIYLPSRDNAQVDTLHFEDELDTQRLESMLAERTRMPVSLNDELVRVERVASREQALALVRMSGVYDGERLADMQVSDG
ncbi:hypothetical protein C8E00_103325 [Chromohalobacter marismortui]|uniref:Uncharacterized protein n=2 Tax=Chromohalobacter marismortui TaxID=42055 RepID=A0A4R7NPX1_9GAMM|nr:MULTISPECIES: hypothetical protein [Chromohalobacter]MCI0508473.1 hypothetical protein [Chromohalobacter sp.]MCI0591807.1 hypothetical protein [Chromohalobacter sp.]TDU22953.1 hypothetical protein C8E00_103325 [Chromohalobacter marismortui]